MTVGRRGSCPNPNIPLAGRQLKKIAAYFTMLDQNTSTLLNLMGMEIWTTIISINFTGIN